MRLLLDLMKKPRARRLVKEPVGGPIAEWIQVFGGTQGLPALEVEDEMLSYGRPFHPSKLGSEAP